MLASHGRGGAGNMADRTQTPKTDPQDLQTPTLKSSVVTTGRGGTGNMAKNTDPRETRLRQDVEAVARRSSSGAQYAGRGGAGNVFKGEEAELARKAGNDQAIDDGPETLATKGKNWLFGKKA
ncbi:hypothetical protein QQX98_005446 [Neonectria punicea]|uniref:SMP domain-containing protein n=1 Tax=Neonectria punicea TaxID=979145 RepID=A0ABR1H5E0_9HYPO